MASNILKEKIKDNLTSFAINFNLPYNKLVNNLDLYFNLINGEVSNESKSTEND